jgi:hypothetical protein
MADAKTFREFLTTRNLNPADFEVVIKHFEDKVSNSYAKKESMAWYTGGWTLRDVKREGDVIVVLRCHSSSGSTPGIRRETSTTVFVNEVELGCERDIYVDGGRQTHHLDRPERNFSRIVGWERDGSSVKVTLGNEAGSTGEVKVRKLTYT